MTVTVDDHYYEVAKTGSLSSRFVTAARNHIYADFLRVCKPKENDTILDVGISDVMEEGSNFLERLYPFKQMISAVGLGEAKEFKKTFPEIRYRQIVAGERFPFNDTTFDIATCNAVLEHVGSVAGQKRFVAEMLRVSRRVFISVPNKFFPIEHHTAIPLAHWTGVSFTVACRLFGKQQWSKKENLILMSSKRLAATCENPSALTGVTGLPLGPFSSNLFLYVEK